MRYAFQEGLTIFAEFTDIDYEILETDLTTNLILLLHYFLLNSLPFLQSFKNYCLKAFLNSSIFWYLKQLYTEYSMVFLQPYTYFRNIFVVSYFRFVVSLEFCYCYTFIILLFDTLIFLHLPCACSSLSFWVLPVLAKTTTYSSYYVEKWWPLFSNKVPPYCHNRFANTNCSDWFPLIFIMQFLFSNVMLISFINCPALFMWFMTDPSISGCRQSTSSTGDGRTSEEARHSC